MAEPQHRYFARSTQADRDHSHRVEGSSFEAAAVAFVETWIPDQHGEVSVVVRDRDTGREECFRIDIDSGAARPCG